jgi:hypothetical protein
MTTGAQGSGGGDARSAEAYRENAINDGKNNINGVFGQFDDNFFKDRRQSYLDYATPQLNDQYANTRSQLTYALDRAGNLNSSSANTQTANLAKLYDTNRRTVDDNALGYENTARTNIADAKSGLINNVSATGDANGAAADATSRASALSQPDAYQPLGQLFSSVTSGLQTQAQLEQLGAFSGGQIKPAFNTGLFGTSPGAVKVTG